MKAGMGSTVLWNVSVLLLLGVAVAQDNGGIQLACDGRSTCVIVQAKAAGAKVARRGFGWVWVGVGWDCCGGGTSHDARATYPQHAKDAHSYFRIRAFLLAFCQRTGKIRSAVRPGVGAKARV